VSSIPARDASLLPPPPSRPPRLQLRAPRAFPVVHWWCSPVQSARGFVCSVCRHPLLPLCVPRVSATGRRAILTARWHSGGSRVRARARGWTVRATCMRARAAPRKSNNNVGTRACTVLDSTPTSVGSGA
jgi:hypothetical protein